ncbi:MAG: 23S rRNA (adenine(2503)-C(2))-methyltransferase RlmN [Deltaproteobacteria bacterium]|jgi:23S rRNA (adenine2503-C2)-methyltransferase|nr:23S rRNA (adenine(2503)-C(2))-methyltransferase RlmN [Deltaproteobacteria bacterium]MBW2449617.1 23S rRNA (adenine(2503)-C(2))-methyltransferase RlmN [Deltaproteobacteria bacterium]
MLPKTDIKELSRDDLILWLKDQDIKSYRANQILKWIYLRQADTFEVMTDIKIEIRNQLSQHFSIHRLEKTRVETSQDGTKKYLFKLSDGKYIESVLIPEKDHYTLCISSQVGCAQGCLFCLTAKGGFIRNLTKGEIIAQVRDVAYDIGSSKRLTNIVMMGMGEPLANFSNVVNAINIITDSDIGLGFSSRRVTVSTSGLVSKLSDLGRETSANLAISLNATENKTRNMLMPINRKYPMESLLKACAKYPLMPRRRITFEYILIKGINDSEEDAKRLVKLLRPIRAKINLIPFNTYQGSQFERPDESVVLKFKEILSKNNYTTIVRHSKGQDISAACGQLSANLILPKVNISNSYNNT